MKKYKSYMLLLGIMLIVTALITSTYAWYINYYGIEEDNKNYSANQLYYASGTGTKEDPYIINEPRHLYNLAWLQDLGFYDEGNEKYFKLEKDIDMSAIKKLPPIGIDAHPFISYFDGNGHIIKNLEIETKIDNFKIKPSDNILQEHTNDTAKDNTILTSYVGLFGIINTVDVQSTTNYCEGVSNFYIDNCIINYKINKSISGIIAGYVNGNISKIGVSKSYINVDRNVYGDGNDKTISKYTLVGDVSEDADHPIKWEDKPGAQGIGFGGSIDIRTLCRRVNYIQSKLSNGIYNASLNNTVTFPQNSIDSGFNYQFQTYESTKEFDWKTSGTIYGDLLTGSYLPVNVDLGKMGLNSSEEKTGVSYRINKEYASKTSEDVSSSNSAYFAGKLRLKIKPMAGGESIFKSLGYSTEQSSYTFNDANYNNVLFLTKTSNENIIIDKNNKSNYSGNKTNPFSINEDGQRTVEQLGYTRYYDVKSSLYESFKQQSSLYGLRFMSKICDYGNTDKMNYVNAKNISLAGKTYDNYQLIDNAINFNLYTTGVVCYVAGSYYCSGTNYNIFKINRDNNGSVTSKEMISNVYKNDEEYIINSTTGEGTKIYDENASKHLGLESGMYYFEIPLPKGEYALGITGNYTNSLYLMYLDIGANGSSQSTPDYKATIEYIDFVYLPSSVEDMAKIFTSSYTYTKVLFQISGEATAQVVLYFERKDPNTSSPDVGYYIGNSSGGVTVSPIGDGATSTTTLPTSN